jgi:hypothetical protein
MAEAINCPQCTRELRIPENLMGKRVKCPNCGTIFTAPAPGEAPPPSSEAAPTINEPGPPGEGPPAAPVSVGDESTSPPAAPPLVRPKEIDLIGHLALFGGIWACLLPILCCLSGVITYFIRGDWWAMCCLCPQVYSIAVGVLSILAGLKLRGPDAYLQPPPQLNAILRIVNLILNLDILNAIGGGLTLYWLMQKPEVLNYYKGTATGLAALLPTKNPADMPPPPPRP